MRRTPELDTTKSWEERYKQLEQQLLKESRDTLEHAPLRPAMYIGQYRDNRDAEFLVWILIDAMHMMIRLKGKDDHDFQMKWGTGARYYHKNVNHDKTHEENLKTIKAMADDFLFWIEQS
jgi:hypothetical protein